MLSFDLEGTTIHVRDDGPRDGRVVMFANSLGTDLRVWDPMLAHMPSDLRIVRYDKRGHGLSDCPDAPYSIEQLAQDAEVIAERLDLRDVSFVGLSIGGLIGQALAAKRPDLIRDLVLVDTAAKIGDAAMWNDRVKALRSGGLEPMVDPIMERWFAASFRADPAQVAPWRHMLARTPLEGYIGCCNAIAAADLTESTKALTLPVMAMAGSEDGSTPPDLVRATAALCGAEFHEIDDAGHLPNVEKPALTARLITAFLERTAP